MGHTRQTLVGPQVFLVAAYDVTSGGQVLTEPLMSVAHHPVVVEHTYPTERIGGYHLWRGRRVTALCQPVGGHRHASLLDGVPGQECVAGVVQGEHGLNPGVAKILKLFVIGAVHIGFVGTEAGGAPAYLLHLLQFPTARR